MKLPLNLLKKYIASPGKPEAIAELLTLSGSAVEKTESLATGLEKVVVAEILEVLKHPNADRLQLAKVKYGQGKMTDVVCGAPNISVGQKVPLALPGTTLPNGMTLEITKIRGIESRGMLCAEDELGLGDDHNGILILDNGVPIGTPLPAALQFSEAIFDVDVTPNRADCFSIEGLAREYAALTGKTLKKQKGMALSFTKKKSMKVTVVSKKVCAAYYACRVSEIAIAPSPLWMQTALREVGIRPINNVVDVTNYVMIMTGQPMHAFDGDKVQNKGVVSITVRMAKKGEKILALDDTTYDLDESMQVIADADKPIAIAGVIGGKEASVTDATTSIVLEAAQFDGPVTRKASRKLGVRTESSARFEKGIHREGMSDAIAFALQLLKEVAGGVPQEIVIESSQKTRKPRVVNVSYERIAEIVGETIPKTKIKQALTSLGFSIKDAPQNTMRITIPTFRQDVALAEDIIEEVVRMHGVNNLTPSPIQGDILSPKTDSTRELISTLKQAMVAHGFYELYLHPYYGDKDRRGDSLSMFCDGRYDHLEVKNPMSPDQKYIRKSLLPGLLKNLSKNIGHAGGEDLKLFELGKIFIPQGTQLPHEYSVLAGVMSLRKSKLEEQLRYAKGVVESVLGRANRKMSYTIQGLHDRGVVFEVEGKPVAMVYVLSSQELATYKLKKPAVLIEVFVTRLSEQVGTPLQYAAYSAFPSVTRDVAIEVAPDVLWGQVQKHVKGAHLESSSFMSQFPLDGKKSLAFRMVFRSMKETLISETVDKEVEKITSLLKEKFNATIRGE